MNIKDSSHELDNVHISSSKHKPRSHAKSMMQNEYFRAANEDDDGYDPYSDRPVSNPMFEEDPWR